MIKRLCMCSVVAWCLASAAYGAEREIAPSELRERVRGAWAGKMIGVSYGAPTEFRHNGKIIPPEKLPQWKPQMISEALSQDDLYVQMTYSQVLDAKGLSATTADFAEMLKQSQYPLWHTSQAARRALRRGATVEQLASPITSIHGEDISFQIIADFIGLSCPGMPNSAIELSDRVSRVAAWGEGACAGRFVAGMYTAAFFETDARKIIAAGLSCVPAESDYVRAIRHVLDLHQQHPADWETAWRRFNEKWDNRDCCTQGALRPFNIDAPLNGGYSAIGLLYGGDDFAKVVEIATRCGQDSDCNPCTAAGVWGAAHGFSKIPETYTSGIDAIANEKFIFTDSTFNSAVDNSVKRAVMVAESAGGSVRGDRLVIIEQIAQAPPVRDFPAFGRPVERIGCDDPRWKFTGPWRRADETSSEQFAGDKGAEAAITFRGTGAIIVGPYIGGGGRADIYLDGKLDRTIDVYSDDPNRRVWMEDVWHIFNLRDGEHTVRLVVRGERFGDSTGTEVRIQSLVVFR